MNTTATPADLARLALELRETAYAYAAAGQNTWAIAFGDQAEWAARAAMQMECPQ